MAQTSNRPGVPGKYEMYRIVASADPSPITAGESRGLQCIGLEKIHVQVIVSGNAPTLNVLSWSPAVGAFVPLVPAVSATGPGAGESFEFTVDSLDRTLFISASEACEIWTSGVRNFSFA